MVWYFMRPLQAVQVIPAIQLLLLLILPCLFANCSDQFLEANTENEDRWVTSELKRSISGFYSSATSVSCRLFKLWRMFRTHDEKLSSICDSKNKRRRIELLFFTVCGAPQMLYIRYPRSIMAPFPISPTWHDGARGLTAKHKRISKTNNKENTD